MRKEIKELFKESRKGFVKKGLMKEEIKELFMELYKDFPNSRLSEEVVHKIIITENDRNFLENRGFLLKEEMNSGDKRKKYYNLGPNALQLISSWKLEKLTTWIIVLTTIIVICTILTLIFV